ncbi:hypothetical protein [Desulfitobacterium metallireducens]|uniref:Uncharacterized protein n=1 Tax=Desulfitobacterium metallireducens DSM 15288 TaxID=871968 RepID=W0ECT2_9FIRM|nr:hypothetical protein [Desulfitobacterium metallireducens]AHF08577.1 hypothetical protein DESME_08975 [Desulfitobacterium metallireducens DSM 15288]
MIIDPRVSGCFIWFMDKSKVQYINGSPKKCVDRIIKYATKLEIDEEIKENKRIQWCPIRIDLSGSVGKTYAKYLQENKIKFDVAKWVTDII